VLVLGDALPVRRVGRSPEGQRVDVEILPIEVDALLGQELVHVVGEPLPGRGVAQVQKARVAFTALARPVI